MEQPEERVSGDRGQVPGTGGGGSGSPGPEALSLVLAALKSGICDVQSPTAIPSHPTPAVIFPLVSPRRLTRPFSG